MKAINIKNRNLYLLLLLGITLFVQATTSLIGGLLFLSPFSPKEMSDSSLKDISQNLSSIQLSILLNMITAVVIILLGVAMFQLSYHLYKTLSIIALCFYLIEATMLVVGQIFVFGLTKVSFLYIDQPQHYFIDLANLCIYSKEFIGQMAMIFFGLGAIIFYFLMMKVGIFPKWLALWALITVPFILIGIPLIAFNINIPFFFFAPYVPFEFFAGIYVLIRVFRKKYVLTQL